MYVLTNELSTVTGINKAKIRYSIFNEYLVKGKGMIIDNMYDISCLTDKTLSKTKFKTKEELFSKLAQSFGKAIINRESYFKEKSDFSDLVKEYHNQIWFRSNTTKYIIHVGPTNSGKTYNSIQKLKQAKSGAYLSPLRLLAYEIYEKLVSEDIPCNLKTGEYQIDNKNANIDCCTIELMNYHKHYDCIVIDECFMVSDPHRGSKWLKAILESNASEIHIISSLESETMITTILEKTSKTIEKCYYQRKTPLVVSKTPMNINKPFPKTVFVTFSRVNVLYYKQFFESKGISTSIIYGDMLPEIKQTQMNLFITGKTQVCVSTDAIGMGLNLPCDNVYFLKIEKYDGIGFRELNPTEVKQIAGRAGRYKLSEQGIVYAPDKQSLKYLEQCLNISTEFKKAYCGINYNFLKKISKKKLKDKIIYYTELNLIPDELKKHIELENVSRLLELASYPVIDKIDDEVSWKLINLPVNNNNQEFWFYIVDCINTNTQINFTPIISEIKNNSVLKEAEIELSKIDLLKSCYYSGIKHIDKNLIESFNTSREQLIEQINQYLLSRKK